MKTMLKSSKQFNKQSSVRVQYSYSCFAYCQKFNMVCQNAPYEMS